MDIGYTLAIWIILGGIALFCFLTDSWTLSSFIDNWLALPWWGQVLSIIGPIIIWIIGGVFEDSRTWNKL
jgi:hypothetical protein